MSKLDWIEISGGDVVGAIPSVPGGLKTSVIGGTRFKLSWVGSIDDKGVAGYEVFKDNVSLETTTSTSLLLENLSPTTSYNLEVRASDADGNWSENSPVFVGKTNNPKLTGTILGTSGTWAGTSQDDITTVFDGNINNFFDSTTGDYAWVGLDLGSAKTITSILYYPRSNFPSRMTGGSFQASNSSDFSTANVTLYTVSTQPPVDWNEVNINLSSGFRYVRYSAPKEGYGNIAEVEFYGKDFGTGISPISDTKNLMVFPNPATEQITIKNVSANSMVSIYTIEGKQIYSQRISKDGEVNVDVSQFIRGIYLVKINGSGSAITEKIIIN
jgi:hypothetical protein